MPKALFKIVLLAFFSLHAFEDVNASPFSDKSPIILQSQSFGVPEGLSQSTVTSIVQDNDGYIWIGTFNGLNRFDGKNFKHFYANDTRTGLPSSFIRSLLIDDKGILYVGTDSGLVVYDKLQESFSQYGLSVKSSPVWSLNSSDKSLIVGTNKAIIDINNKEKTYELSNKGLSEIKKTIKVGDDYYIRDYAGTLFKFTQNELKEIAKKTIDFEQEDHSTLLISLSDGLYKYKDNKIVKIDPQVFSQLTKHKNTIYGITNKNIVNISKNSIVGLLATDSTDSTDKTSSFFATEDMFILGSIDQGVIFIKKVKNLVQQTNLIKDNTWHLTKNPQGFLVSSESEMIELFDENFNLIESFDTQSQGYKYAILNDDGLYFGTSTGLFLKTAGTVKLISEKSISSLSSNKDNSLIAAGTSDGKVLIISKGEVIRSVDTKKNEPIFDIELESTDVIYTAGQGGLKEYKNGLLKNLSEEITYSIVKDDHGIYFGTSTSLMFYNKNNNKTSEVFSNKKEIYSIVNSNNFLTAASLSEVIIYEKKNEKSYTLKTSNGSQYEYNSPSGIDVNGYVLLAGINGVSLVSPINIVNYINNRKINKTEISEFLVFNIIQENESNFVNKKNPTKNEITLKYSDYPFSFNFISPMSDDSSTNYHYRMYGLSDTWISANGTNSATYTNLSPGKYTFQVYAVDSLSGEKSVTKELDVIITPPWWSSFQAKSIYVVITIFISFIIVKAILRRRETQRQIVLSEERLKLSLWGSGDEMWDWDIETGNIFRSNIWGALEFPRDGHRSGKSDEESNIHPMDQERVREALNKHFYGETDHFEAAYRVKGKDDNWVWILDRAKIVERDDKDNALRMTGTIKNISQFKQKEEQLKLFEKAIENISEGMFILDNEYRFVEVNEACCKISLRNRTDFIGNLLTFDLYPETFSTQIRTMLKQQGRWANEVEAARGDNSHFHMELTIDAIYDELGELSHYVGVFSDISRRKQQEEELRKLTNNDLLTGLPNRSNLQVTLNNLVNREIAHALMVLDLDNFKRINDSLGHQIGDTLLKLVATRIKSLLPKNTSIYRLGGDEFAIVLDKGSDISASAAIANRIIEGLKPAFDVSNEQLVLGLSIGIVLFPEDEQSEQALLRKADIAMYHAKSAGGNCYQFYSESLNQHAIRQLEIENLIREGLKDDLFEVYYQPKVDLKSGKIAGMEALVRLNHPIHGLIPPNDFIPLAEENGLIVEIGEIVLRKACFAAQKWREQGIFSGRVAVNLSSRQFALPDIQQRIESILRLTKLPACHLELEITEGTVIKQPETAIIVMQQLAKMGVSLALDDFGTGYSSLSYLKRFPIHTLKIDKAFVDDIDKSDRDLKMVDSIITIAHNMGLSVVGEGVEQTAQLNILRALNCEEIQGYIFSKAIKETEFTLLLQKDMAKPNTRSNIT
ncbi:EAL domain-containing protein [Shewanella sp. SW32]|uniref:EAL domain-containing protein n=1 Tax=unclassified Shewanella TaxID=196818 RepID=UPI0021D7D3FC|nr:MULTISPECIES: EAL domain-containing protein [unclassified Shewanella]MCU7963117.1 EAL domain-containing protein [Shewanella sp. SW32]MCU7971013.1 EAL domain-containing protein [Shewanella sp. SW29]